MLIEQQNLYINYLNVHEFINSSSRNVPLWTELTASKCLNLYFTWLISLLTKSSYWKNKNKEVKQIKKKRKQHKKICFHFALHLLAFQISSAVILVDNHKLPLPLCGYPKVLKSIGQCWDQSISANADLSAGVGHIPSRWKLFSLWDLRTSSGRAKRGKSQPREFRNESLRDTCNNKESQRTSSSS